MTDPALIKWDGDLGTAGDTVFSLYTWPHTYLPHVTLSEFRGGRQVMDHGNFLDKESARAFVEKYVNSRLQGGVYVPPGY